jgi:hypothetical protein
MLILKWAYIKAFVTRVSNEYLEYDELHSTENAQGISP